jgi:formylglycine-generating enzyme required for sulfatase activity
VAIRAWCGNTAYVPQYRQLFVADGLPKTQRVNLPPLAEILHYLDTVREKVLDYLETVDLDQQERLWRWLIQHESQHSETIAFVLQLQQWGIGVRDQGSGVRENIASHLPPLQRGDKGGSPRSSSRFANASRLDEMIEIPGGYFEQGNECIDALDNERPIQRVNLETYWIDRYPVTCGQYKRFMEAGGYQNPIGGQTLVGSGCKASR